MIINDKEIVFINYYVMNKEFHYTDKVREAISLIHYLYSKKNIDKALAIDIVSKKFKKDYNLDFSKDFLLKVHRQRCAHIKNAKEAFKQYCIEKRIESIPDVENLKLCACGCGQPVKKGNKFINGHNSRMMDSKILNEKAEKMRIEKLKKYKKQEECNLISFDGYKKHGS